MCSYGINVNSEKDFANNSIDTTVAVMLAAAIVRVAPKIDKSGTNVYSPKLDFDINYLAMESLSLGLTAAFVSSLHQCGVLPVLK